MIGPGYRYGLCIAATVMVMGAVPAQAAMSCWNENQVAAARVRDLQSRLMVDALRCRAFGIDILGAYNEFVRSNRATLQAANTVIMGQFSRGYGRDAQTEYDRFATALATEAVAADGDLDRLVQIGERFGPPPELPGGQCPASFASVAALEYSAVE
jgi:hypothetical protein